MPESPAGLARVIAPTALTLGNAVAGLAALLAFHRFVPQDLSTWNFVYFGICLLFLAMILDALDGLVARLMGCTSDFGAELDSLCDGISFGLVPAYLLWTVYAQDQNLLAGRIWGILITLYLGCTLLRLARFNLQRTLQDKADGKKFIGLPSPAAAGCICSLVLLQGRVEAGMGLSQSIPSFEETFAAAMFVVAPLATIFISVLMVSSIPFPHPSRQILGSPKANGKKRKAPILSTSVVLLIFVGLVARSVDLLIILGFWCFAFNGIVQFVFSKPRKRILLNDVSSKVTS